MESSVKIHKTSNYVEHCEKEKDVMKWHGNVYRKHTYKVYVKQDNITGFLYSFNF